MNSCTAILPMTSSSPVRFPCHQDAPGAEKSSAAEVLRLEHQVLDERLVLEVRLVLDGAPPRALGLAHVPAVRGSAGQADVVGDHHRTLAQPATLDDPLEVGQVGVLVVVEEDEV